MKLSLVPSFLDFQLKLWLHWFHSSFEEHFQTGFQIPNDKHLFSSPSFNQQFSFLQIKILFVVEPTQYNTKWWNYVTREVRKTCVLVSRRIIDKVIKCKNSDWPLSPVISNNLANTGPANPLPSYTTEEAILWLVHAIAVYTRPIWELKRYKV